jgi:hypothetical protein
MGAKKGETNWRKKARQIGAKRSEKRREKGAKIGAKKGTIKWPMRVLHLHTAAAGS